MRISKSKALKLYAELREHEKDRSEVRSTKERVIKLQNYFDGKCVVGDSIRRIIAFENGCELILREFNEEYIYYSMKINEINDKLSKAGYPIDGDILYPESLLKY